MASSNVKFNGGGFDVERGVINFDTAGTYHALTTGLSRILGANFAPVVGTHGNGTAFVVMLQGTIDATATGSSAGYLVVGGTVLIGINGTSALARHAFYELYGVS